MKFLKLSDTRILDFAIFSFIDKDTKRRLYMHVFNRNSLYDDLASKSKYPPNDCQHSQTKYV